MLIFQLKKSMDRESESNTPGSLYYVLCDLNQDNLLECMVGCQPYEESRFLGIYAFDGEDIFLLTEGADLYGPEKMDIL